MSSLLLRHSTINPSILVTADNYTRDNGIVKQALRILKWTELYLPKNSQQVTIIMTSHYPELCGEHTSISVIGWLYVFLFIEIPKHSVIEND